MYRAEAEKNKEKNNILLKITLRIVVSLHLVCYLSKIGFKLEEKEKDVLEETSCLNIERREYETMKIMERSRGGPQILF